MRKIQLTKDLPSDLTADGNEYRCGEILQLDDDGQADKLVTEGFGIDVDIQRDLDSQNKISVNRMRHRSGDDNPSGFKSFGDFATAVTRGPSDSQLMSYVKASGMSEAVSSDGGFLVPQEFTAVLLAEMAQVAPLHPRCRDFPINNNLALPFINLTTQATSWTGGMTTYKPAEGIAKTSSKPEIAKCNLKLNKITILVYATDELLQDAPIALETFLTAKAGTELGLTKDEDIVNGSGAGEALGIMRAPCLITESKEGGQPGTTIVLENVLKMWSRLWGPSHARATWLINQDCTQQIYSMGLTVGAAGAPAILINATTNLPEKIFGAPIIWSPHCQTLGTTGDIILADFSQYVTGSKAGMPMETATSIHVKFVEDETAFRFVVRFDGQPWWSSAITPKHGSNTQSPFVALETRS